MQDGTSIGIFVALFAGLLSFLSPCVLPLVPSYVSFITGLGMEELEQGGEDVKRVALIHSLLFVAGFTLIFLLMGASATAIGQLLRQYQDIIARVGGVIIILFGLLLLGWIPIPALSREKRYQFQNKPVGYVGTMAVGAAFGAGWVPCIGPILGAILTLAATRANLYEGVGLLFVYSLGLAIPFVLSAVALTAFLGWFQKFRRYIRYVEWVAGVLLIVVGALLLTGKFTVLAGWLIKFTPEFLLERI
ncbi:MAG: cytochrome c biogenesis protein CcdA [Gemmatimonadetes bacterium]|uniref:Cytochrome c biogenesis protein CcdA n=1 Tax=Candidatus Kutchimonas denitrificans TaxID=3056748 RepID=A0AAE4Z6P8_9BACT|nr:cytochrome c biogenesis protein CcdA [Gemmatimonadota bacterium]NIR74359.1 cytochrome c biogenesis protein CcdA [Candidatus Kutchimonas denitrificans]NIS02610.1 cytochrome c biogenesis protein CcdA [Gemmatimonadota bacterium]NIT68485.1 cytochrome c biogenesis protein CcdA [Gemmatimonadota bacterium]NIU51962.1 cytochrome c biogenesis protein CcdA [Gemmatimonadota bacterium]